MVKTRRRQSIAAAAVAALLLPATASAEMLIGLSAPLSGPSAILGAQMHAGAEVAAAASHDKSIGLDVADDACTADGGAAAARQFVAAGVRIVVGFLCAEAIEAALPILKAAQIPVITAGVRTDSITDRKQKTGWLVYRLAPRADAEREATGKLLTRFWEKDLFAIVDDGTIYGRELAESLRAAAEQVRLKPVFVDTIRPQLDNQIGLVGRLRKAGATHVFVGGDRDDVAVIGRDAAQLRAGLTIAGGEALRAYGSSVPLAIGTLMVAIPEPKPEATELAPFAEREVEPEGYVLPAHAAVEIASAVLADQSQDGPIDLSNREFETILGPVRFDEKGDLAENPYRLLRFDGTAFVEMPPP